jgi:hypothetical protein
VCRERVSRDLAEAALAHAIKDKTEAATTAPAWSSDGAK